MRGQPRRDPLTRLMGADSQNQEPDWGIILSAMYRTEVPEGVDIFIHTNNVFDRRTIREVTNLSDSQVNQALRKLKKWDLVERKSFESDGDYVTHYVLTKEGLRVAHERELSTKSNRINQPLVFFTFILVLAEIIGVAPVSGLTKSVMIIVILGGMLYMVWRTDMME